jgi:putative membrane protein
MKRLSINILIIVSLLIIQGCNNKAKNYNVSNTDSISSDDSLNAVKNNKINVPADKTDVQFAVEAAEGNITEVELGKLALKHAANKRVKNFGAMMIKDHTKTNNKLIAIAKRKNIPLPAEPGATDQKTIDELSKKSGKDFDKAFVENMIRDHENDIKVFENTAKYSSDPEIKAFANKTLRVLKNHLDAINTINSSMK